VCDPPTTEELIKAINQMKNHKAAGADGILAEVYKVGNKTLHTSYSHSYVESGMTSGYPLTYGTRPSSPSLKRATGLTVVITAEFHFCLLPARYLPDCYRIGYLL